MNIPLTGQNIIAAAKEKIADYWEFMLSNQGLITFSGGVPVKNKEGRSIK